MNAVLGIDKLTFGLFIGFWPIWVVWEMILLKLKGQNPSVDLISQVARDRGYQMASMVFAWGSLGGHYWANWKSTPWDSAAPALVFWGLIAACLAWDIYLWNTAYAALPLWMRVVRFPGTTLFLGLLNGFLLFPQRGISGQPF